MSVRIRLKPLGRRHRSYFRIVAIEKRQSRDGRVLEELGTYDPMVKDKDSRVTLKASRVEHWLKVGASPSEKVEVLIKKYLDKWKKIEADRAAGITPESEARPKAEEAQAPAEATAEATPEAEADSSESSESTE